MPTSPEQFQTAHTHSKLSLPTDLGVNTTRTNPSDLSVWVLKETKAPGPEELTPNVAAQVKKQVYISGRMADRAGRRERQGRGAGEDPALSSWQAYVSAGLEGSETHEEEPSRQRLQPEPQSWRSARGGDGRQGETGPGGAGNPSPARHQRVNNLGFQARRPSRMSQRSPDSAAIV